MVSMENHDFCKREKVKDLRNAMLGKILVQMSLGKGTIKTSRESQNGGLLNIASVVNAMCQVVFT